MLFAYTILYVDDVTASLDFYARAFGLERRMLHESGDYGELDTGSTALAFANRTLMQSLGKSPAAPDPDRPAFEIAFTTDDVAGSVSRAVQAGAALVRAPERMPWGQDVAYVRDDSGFLVEICTPMGAGG